MGVDIILHVKMQSYFNTCPIAYTVTLRENYFGNSSVNYESMQRIRQLHQTELQGNGRETGGN